MGFAALNPSYTLTHYTLTHPVRQAKERRWWQRSFAAAPSG
jgi:hypothetical protein